MVFFCQPLIDRTVQPMDAALKDAGQSKGDIEEVILVGGQRGDNRLWGRRRQPGPGPVGGHTEEGGGPEYQCRRGQVESPPH